MVILYIIKTHVSMPNICCLTFPHAIIKQDRCNMQQVMFDEVYKTHFHLNMQHTVAMAGVTLPSTSAYVGITRTKLVSQRYFSQFQVVTKMDDPPNHEKVEL